MGVGIDHPPRTERDLAGRKEGPDAGVGAEPGILPDGGRTDLRDGPTTLVGPGGWTSRPPRTTSRVENPEFSVRHRHAESVARLNPRDRHVDPDLAVRGSCPPSCGRTRPRRFPGAWDGTRGPYSISPDEFLMGHSGGEVGEAPAGAASGVGKLPKCAGSQGGDPGLRGCLRGRAKPCVGRRMPRRSCAKCGRSGHFLPRGRRLPSTGNYRICERRTARRATTSVTAVFLVVSPRYQTVCQYFLPRLARSACAGLGPLEPVSTD